MEYKISESEWQLMELLWQGEMTQPQLMAQLGHKWNKNTVHTFLARLCSKGYVDVDKERSPHVYHASVSREDCEKQERESFLQRVYTGRQGRPFSLSYTSLPGAPCAFFSVTKTFRAVSAIWQRSWLRTLRMRCSSPPVFNATA